MASVIVRSVTYGRDYHFVVWMIVSIALSNYSAIANASELHQTDSEMEAYIPVTNGRYIDKKVIYSIGPITLHTGSIVDFRLQAEVTNNCGDNIGFGRNIIMGRSPSATDGTILSKAVMSNVTANEHHEVIVHTGLYLAEFFQAQVYINVIFWAVSTPARCAGDRLIIEGHGNKGFGELVVELR